MKTEPVLRVANLSKTYSKRRWLSSKHLTQTALAGVSFELRERSTLALAGPSGAGKSTLVRCIVGREKPDAGEICFQGRNVGWPRSGEFRRAVQLIPQDPGASLNPRLTALEIISEPLAAHRLDRVSDLMKMVGLSADSRTRRADTFSGGQRSRLAIARALACEPRVLILDESLSSLDLSVQAQIVNLLVDLQERLGLAYILIAHDLSIAGHLADRIAIMDCGGIVEEGFPDQLFRKPQHPRTRELLAAAVGG
jgi:ABC-type glutathione transport system ATPase component